MNSKKVKSLMDRLSERDLALFQGLDESEVN